MPAGSGSSTAPLSLCASPRISSHKDAQDLLTSFAALRILLLSSLLSSTPHILFFRPSSRSHKPRTHSIVVANAAAPHNEKSTRAGLALSLHLSSELAHASSPHPFRLRTRTSAHSTSSSAHVRRRRISAPSSPDERASKFKASQRASRHASIRPRETQAYDLVQAARSSNSKVVGPPLRRPSRLAVVVEKNQRVPLVTSPTLRICRDAAQDSNAPSARASVNRISGS